MSSLFWGFIYSTFAACSVFSGEFSSQWSKARQKELLRNSVCPSNRWRNFERNIRCFFYPVLRLLLLFLELHSNSWTFRPLKKKWNKHQSFSIWTQFKWKLLYTFTSISNTVHEIVNSICNFFYNQTDKGDEHSNNQKNQQRNEFLNRYSRKWIIITFHLSILVKIPWYLMHMPRCSDLRIKFIEKW